MDVIKGDNKANRNMEDNNLLLVTVCSECLQASCWQGIFMCDNAMVAGTTEKTKEELTKLNLENPSYWENI